MPYRSIDTTFGDGCDGHAHFVIGGGATQYFTKPVHQYASLTVDAGVTLRQRNWAICMYPVQWVYCRSPIVLNGILSVTGAAAGVDGGGTMYPGSLVPNSEAMSGLPPYFHGSGQSIYPVPGGSSGGTTVIKEPVNHDPYVPFYHEHWYSGWGANGWDGDAQTLAKLVGPGRIYRFCAGIGGAQGNMSGGSGGGIIVITAPAILFGAEGGVHAKGENGQDDPSDEAGGGGGGGGYIETATRIAVDAEKLDASGGVGGAGMFAGEAGVAGLVLRRLI